MDYEARNTVPALNQMHGTGSVFFLQEKEAPGFRVLFLGNSITLHGYKPEIGWMRSDCGMAASGPERDYVHLVLKWLTAKKGTCSACLAQMSNWERNYWEPNWLAEHYQEAADWKAQLVIVRLGENVRAEHMAEREWLPYLEKMVRFFTVPGAKLLFTDTFWPCEKKEGILAEAARHFQAPLVRLADLGAQKEMRAEGLFAHSGVAAHPGDAGMAAIAERICQGLEGLL